MANNDVISSLIVEVNPDFAESAETALNAFSGVEVHERHSDKLVVTIEAESVEASAQMAENFSSIPGVLAVNLIYMNCEGVYE